MNCKEFRFMVYTFILLFFHGSYAGVQEADAYLYKGNMQKALREYVQAADKGDANAQYQAGLMYAYGIGEKINYEKARDYLSKSAAQGYERSILFFYETAKLKTLYPEEARRWLDSAINAGSVSAIYAKRPGDIGSDIGLARALARQGNFIALNRLEDLGEGTPATDYIQFLRKYIKFPKNVGGEANLFYRKKIEGDGGVYDVIRDELLKGVIDDPAITPDKTRDLLPNPTFDLLYKNQSRDILESKEKSIEIAVKYIQANREKYFNDTERYRFESCFRVFDSYKIELAKIFASTNPYIKYANDEPRYLSAMYGMGLGRLASRISSILVIEQPEGMSNRLDFDLGMFRCRSGGRAQHTPMGAYSNVSVGIPPIKLYPEAIEQEQNFFKRNYSLVGATMLHELIHYAGVSNEGFAHAADACFAGAESNRCNEVASRVRSMTVSNLSLALLGQVAAKDFFDFDRYLRSSISPDADSNNIMSMGFRQSITNRLIELFRAYHFQVAGCKSNNAGGDCIKKAEYDFYADTREFALVAAYSDTTTSTLAKTIDQDVFAGRVITFVRKIAQKMTTL